MFQIVIRSLICYVIRGICGSLSGRPYRLRNDLGGVTLKSRTVEFPQFDKGLNDSFSTARGAATPAFWNAFESVELLGKSEIGEARSGGSSSLGGRFRQGCVKSERP